VVGVYILTVAKRSKPLAFEQVKYYLKPWLKHRSATHSKNSATRMIEAYVTRPGVDRESRKVPVGLCRDLSKRCVVISRVQQT